MAAKYILPAVAAVFVTLALLRILRDGGKPHPQTRTWLLVAGIFSVVSAWLWLRGS